MNEQYQWEEAIRSKLHDYEAKTEPEDWLAIAGRLPEVKRMVIHLRLQRYAAAAAIALLLSGAYLYYHDLVNKQVIAGIPTGEIQPETVNPRTVNPPATPADSSARPLMADASPVRRTANLPVAAHPAKTKEKPAPEQTPLFYPVPDETPETTSASETMKEPEHARTQLLSTEQNEVSTLLADTRPASAEKRSRKRWGFGVGGGSYSVGNNGGGTMDLFATNKAYIYNAETIPVLSCKVERQNVSHKLPLSFGLGVSYALDERWSLQSGLTYTLLASKWQTLSEYPGEAKQQLHFIGLPVSVNYKIAEWNRFRFYATSGGMAEWNVSGQIRTNYYNGGQKMLTEKESVRMKEWLWSVNARAGVSYPLLRFIGAYVEGGANYYFDNGSFIETVRSDKPFHVSLQAGIRFGF